MFTQTLRKRNYVYAVFTHVYACLRRLRKGQLADDLAEVLIMTGDESRKLFAISLTAEQISQIYFSTSSNEEWVQRPQIEIQPTTGAIVE
jgi:hypothetical protein